MDLTKYQEDKYTIEEQLPVKQDGKWIKRIYVYEEGKGHPVDQGVIELTEEEALALLPPKPVDTSLKLNLRQFMLQLLGTPLFDELNTYLKGYPTLVEFTKDGILTQEEVTKLLEHLDLHLGAQIVSQDLYNVIKGALTNEG